MGGAAGLLLQRGANDAPRLTAASPPLGHGVREAATARPTRGRTYSGGSRNRSRSRRAQVNAEAGELDDPPSNR